MSPYYNDGTSGAMPPTILNPNAGFIITCLSGQSWTGSNFQQNNAILLGLAPTNIAAGGGRILYHMSGAAGMSWLGSNNNGMQITDIQAIDIKIDDGLPNSGQFGVAYGCIAGTNSYTPTVSTCNLYGLTGIPTVAIAGKLLGY